MIILTKNNETIQIPNYDDLENKPKINGVTLEGDLSNADLGIEVDTSDFYTKSESDNRFQPKGNYLTSVPNEYATKTYVSNNYQPKGDYLTSIPSEYITETELNNALNQKDYATISYVDTQIGDINTILENIIG